MKAFKDSPEPVGVPERVVGAWTEGVLHQSGEGTRGFGGRLYFYERGSATPIRVDGRLVVYAFAEDGREETDNKPTKRYVFPAEQFVRHESMTDIGPSYSIWLPWDATGGEQTDVSLIARFEPSQGGGLVVSDQTHHRLPGAQRQETMVAEKTNMPSNKQSSTTSSKVHEAAQVVYEEEQPAQKLQMTATSIPLPGRYNRNSATVEHTQLVPKVTTPRVTTQKVTSEPAAVPPAVHQATPIGTTVEYLTPGESVRRSLQQRSFGSSQ